ncbi:hypothetical protein [Bacillus chungangensis]|uniref:Uncharacterized protein n=1 Tax=Bacillus chungangensis TaxID=587633 RepID=A0ABT9WST0_9BACI|nr:hypothetical protein [Bacillus chungangensis]MDQ0176331.1 hypothetical protein [Bacillus chungangensis]
MSKEYEGEMGGVMHSNVKSRMLMKFGYYIPKLLKEPRMDN